TTAKYYTPAEGNTSTLVKSSGPEYYSENGKYDHPYQTWEGRRHPTEYDSVLSDTDNSDLGGSYFSESTVQLHGRGRVPDLIYHTTDSSTSNESSPDEERRPARSKKSEYARNKIGNNQSSRDAVCNSENRAEHMGQLKETTFTLQPKQPHAFNYSAPHMFPQREFDNIVHYPNNSTHLMNLHNHRRQDESAPELSSEKLHQTKKSSECGEDYTIRV
uniref:Uncharacterized protein n=1 Tax=Strigamia maritima TaxID=126957 RepID=T1JMZ3_STRMM